MLDRTESETLRVATGMIWIPGGTLRMGSDKHLCGSGAGPNHETDVQKTCCIPENPRGGRDNASSDPNLPDIKIPRKVIRGGSHLCAPNYRRHHRRAARMLSPSTRPRTTSASLRGEKFRRNDAANAFLSRR
jgi:formylglycine-generating enzyme required for sulfatase activity